jgi:probable phosphoglycerate mutase
MTRVAVVRPGWTDFDEQHRILGSLELPLNQRGEAQVLALISRLQDLSLDLEVVLSGTGLPVKPTADAIGEALGIDVRESESLNNVNQGLWQGSSIEEIRRKTPRCFKQWEDAPETICPPEGEPWDEVIERVQQALKKPLRKFDSLVIVASEPLATLVSSVLTGEPPDLSAAFPEAPRDPIVEVFESTGRDGEFERRAEADE